MIYGASPARETSANLPQRRPLRNVWNRYRFPPVLGLCLPDWRRSRRSPIVQTGRCTEMLVLTRKSNQSIMIGDDIEVSVLSVMGEKVRIGIQAPQHVPVFRKEIYLEIQQEQVGTPAPDSPRETVDEALDNLSKS